MYCRHILAVCHFNCNLHRDERTTESDSAQIKVVYPKFKNGEATVRSLRVLPNFDYVEEIFNCMLGADEKKLDAARDALVKMTPAPMNTMLEKQPKEEAIQKHFQRKEKDVINVPPTELPTQVQTPVPQQTERAKPHCKKCGNPMKGHAKVTNCPRNQK